MAIYFTELLQRLNELLCVKHIEQCQHSKYSTCVRYYLYYKVTTRAFPQPFIQKIRQMKQFFPKCSLKDKGTKTTINFTTKFNQKHSRVIKKKKRFSEGPGLQSFYRLIPHCQATVLQTADVFHISSLDYSKLPALWKAGH